MVDRHRPHAVLELGDGVELARAAREMIEDIAFPSDGTSC